MRLNVSFDSGSRKTLTRMLKYEHSDAGGSKSNNSQLYPTLQDGLRMHTFTFTSWHSSPDCSPSTSRSS